MGGGLLRRKKLYLDPLTGGGSFPKIWVCGKGKKKGCYRINGEVKALKGLSATPVSIFRSKKRGRW